MTLPSNIKKKLPAIFITLGSIIIANAAWPILSHTLFVSPNLSRTELLTPIRTQDLAFYAPPPSHISTISTQAVSQEVLGADTVDYTKASNWFPTNDFASIGGGKITHYKISIPAVDIKDAVIAIGGEDLSENIVQYPGTANPGELGAPVIFGHSILRQFYNPDEDNPDRYISIFSKIMTLKDGDEILVDYDGISYRYEVSDKFEVSPEDVFILQQRYDARYLKMVTCVPEGTYLRRGVVQAQLQDINANQDSPRLNQENT